MCEETVSSSDTTGSRKPDSSYSDSENNLFLHEDFIFIHSVKLRKADKDLLVFIKALQRESCARLVFMERGALIKNVSSSVNVTS